jgi:5-methyltetrahydrofolate--homocysteine methyltransferase
LIIIGEKLNSSVKKTREAMENNDAGYIRALAEAQFAAGAGYVDVNAAMFLDNEAEKLLWAVEIAARPEGKISLDSPSAAVIEEVLQKKPMADIIINSITLESERFDSFLPLVLQYNAGVVALPIDDSGIPATAQERVQVAERLVAALTGAGVPEEKIFLDVLVETAATGDGPKTALETARRLRQSHPDIHIVCGLSNVSFGLPKRESLNMAFLAAAIINGLDSAIMDITNVNLRNILYAAQVIAGNDEYCIEFIDYCKKEGI